MISSSKKANGFLDDYFKNQQGNNGKRNHWKGNDIMDDHKIKILVVDEIDFLISRS